MDLRDNLVGMVEGRGNRGKRREREGGGREKERGNKDIKVIILFENFLIYFIFYGLLYIFMVVNIFLFLFM